MDVIKDRSEFPDFKSYVGYRIGVLRVAKGMSIKELSEASGVSQASLCAYERAYTAPLLGTAVSIAEALGCTVNDIIGVDAMPSRQCAPAMCGTAPSEAGR